MALHLFSYPYLDFVFDLLKRITIFEKLKQDIK